METNKIDIEGLKRLSGNDEGFVTEILRLYSDRATKDMEELQSAQLLKDWGTIRFVVHRMRSAAVPLGLKNIVVILKKVEMKLKDEIVDGVESEVDEILTMTREAIDDSNNHLSLISA